ncbi:MAG: hypothetical protein WCP26_11005 [Actinomycetes bacterium]
MDSTARTALAVIGASTLAVTMVGAAQGAALPLSIDSGIELEVAAPTCLTAQDIARLAETYPAVVAAVKRQQMAHAVLSRAIRTEASAVNAVNRLSTRATNAQIRAAVATMHKTHIATNKARAAWRIRVKQTSTVRATTRARIRVLVAHAVCVPSHATSPVVVPTPTPTATPTASYTVTAVGTTTSDPSTALTAGAYQGTSVADKRGLTTYGYIQVTIVVTSSASKTTTGCWATYPTTSDSGAINTSAIPKLCTQTLTKQPTSITATTLITNVSGASATTPAFRTSLQAALTLAGM